MSEKQKTGGTRTEVEAITCLEEVRVKSPNSVSLSKEKIESLIPLVKRALEIASDQIEDWLPQAISYEDSGLTISYHLVWSAIPDDSEVKDYVTEEEFKNLCKEVDKAVKEPF